MYTSSRQDQLYDALVRWTHGEVDRRKECHVDCPSCGKPGSPRDTHFSFNAKAGHCFACGKSYKLSELAEFYGLSTTKEKDERPNLTPRADAATINARVETVYVQQWKLNPEKFVDGFQGAADTIQKWEAYRPFDLASMVKWRLGVGILPSCQCKHRRLVYPVVIGGEIVGLRGRAVDCGCKKWLQSAGSSAQMFNSDALVPGCIAFIVESPVDVMLADQLLRGKQPGEVPWVPIAGTAGAGTWKHSWSELLIKKEVAGVYLWLDNDLAGDPNPNMHRKMLSMWRARNPGTKTEPQPAAPKVAASLTSYGLKVDRYQWPDDAPAKADWGWLAQNGGL